MVWKHPKGSYMNTWCHLKPWTTSPASFIEIGLSIQVVTPGVFPPHFNCMGGAPKSQNRVKNGGLSVHTPATPLLSGGTTCPSISGQGTSPGRCPVKITEIAHWASEQWVPEVNPKLDFSESGQSGDMGDPTTEEADGPETCPVVGSKGVSVLTVGCDVELFLWV